MAHRFFNDLFLFCVLTAATSRIIRSPNLGVRVGEHKKEVEAKVTSKFTSQIKKLAEEQQNKSAITGHVTREYHVIDWDQLKVIRHESDRKTRWIKEATAIRKCKDMYEPGLRVVPLTIQLRQAPSPWSSSFPSKWHYTEKENSHFWRRRQPTSSF